jgi:hypothetical protein
VFNPFGELYANRLAEQTGTQNMGRVWTMSPTRYCIICEEWRGGQEYRPCSVFISAHYQLDCIPQLNTQSTEKS